MLLFVTIFFVFTIIIIIVILVLLLEILLHVGSIVFFFHDVFLLGKGNSVAAVALRHASTAFYNNHCTALHYCTSCSCSFTNFGYNNHSPQ